MNRKQGADLLRQAAFLSENNINVKTEEGVCGEVMLYVPLHQLKDAYEKLNQDKETK